MASGVFDDALIKHLWSTDELRAIFNDANRVQKWYDFEAALALEQAELGIIPRAAAQEIAAKAKIANVDVEAIAAEIRRIKHPLVPALKAVEKLCKDGAGEYIHFGPTTQDVLDTAVVLQMKEAHAIYLRDMKGIGQALAQIGDDVHQRKLRAYQLDRQLEADRQLTAGSERIANHTADVSAEMNSPCHHEPLWTKHIAGPHLTEIY